MTYLEFQIKVHNLKALRYDGPSGDVIAFARKRAEFEEKKLQKLIALAEKCSYASAKTRRASWKRMLALSKANRARMEKAHGSKST